MERAHPAAGAPGRFRLPPQSRISRARDIRALFRRGKRKKTSHLDVFFASSPASRSRVGFVVPRHGRKVVARNRLKRRLREIGRLEVLPRLRESGLEIDVLIRARREAYTASYRVLRRELVEATEAICSERSSSD